MRTLKKRIFSEAALVIGDLMFLTLTALALGAAGLLHGTWSIIRGNGDFLHGAGLGLLVGLTALFGTALLYLIIGLGKVLYQNREYRRDLDYFSRMLSEFSRLREKYSTYWELSDHDVREDLRILDAAWSKAERVKLKHTNWRNETLSSSKDDSDFVEPKGCNGKEQVGYYRMSNELRGAGRSLGSGIDRMQHREQKPKY